MMNKLLIILLAFSLADVSAQEFSMKPKGTISEITVEVQNLFTDLLIEGGNAGEIRVITNDYEGVPEKAAGLRPLSALGPDNTGIGLHINQNGNTVTISGTHRNRNDGDYRIILPANIRLRIDYSGFRSDDITIRGMSNEVEVKSQVGDLKFVDVTGPIVANTLSSDISVVFTSLNQSSPTLITSISGDIEITLPENSKGNLHLSSTSGEIYTDLQFDSVETQGWGPGRSFDPGAPAAAPIAPAAPVAPAGTSNINIKPFVMEGGKGFHVGTAANTRMNGGGVEFTVRSVSGDIFLRKK